ncbi:DNA-directed RNA polymerase subunit M/transcription elongation factor TFIIS [Lysinibacillus sp. RC46]|uniref:hypothetical protein n=1 Tax=Lysinibacillus sp. RC46 TaxID=3156295 RepID=UPI0035180CE9
MAKVEGITIDVGIDDKTKLRLRVIAKHVGALADELDRIDKAEECPKCNEMSLYEITEKLVITDFHISESTWHECDKCGYSEKDTELPTRLEGSD